MHQPVGLVVKCLGGELLPPKLADEVALAGVRGHSGTGLAAGAPPPVGVVVVGVHVLQQQTLPPLVGAAGGTGGVQPVDRLVGALAEGFVVGAAADPCPPQEDAGVVAALAHHLPAVLQCLRLPAVVAYMLPARHLCKYQQTQLIAGVQKGGVVAAGADSVAAQLLF